MFPASYINALFTSTVSPPGRSGPNFIGLNAGKESLFNQRFRLSHKFILGNIGGLVLIPGLYKWTTGVSITLDITLTGSAADSELP